MPMLLNLPLQHYSAAFTKGLRYIPGAVLPTVLTGSIGMFIGFIIARLAGWV